MSFVGSNAPTSITMRGLGVFIYLTEYPIRGESHHRAAADHIIPLVVFCSPFFLPKPV
ncbi:unnamed protein product [Ectocarpus sp. 6 AP-2014]